MPERVVAVSHEVSSTTRRMLQDIHAVTSMTKVLAINALTEAELAGPYARQFTNLAQDVARVGETIDQLVHRMNSELARQTGELDQLGKTLVAQIRGTRLTDLALHMIDIVDRNLYERSCDVRWWASEAAVVAAATTPGADTARAAAQRLGVILDSYTVYLDVWVLDTQGRVLATGRGGRYPQAAEQMVGGEEWFKQALATASGRDYAVGDIALQPALGAAVATYATAIREGGRADGAVVGVLAVFFDWLTQGQKVVNSARLSDDEKVRTRCLLVDRGMRVIAASDGQGVLTETFPLRLGGTPMGSYTDEKDHVVGFALTPGYETYRGLGWYGVLVQAPPMRTRF